MKKYAIGILAGLFLIATVIVSATEERELPPLPSAEELAGMEASWTTLEQTASLSLRSGGTNDDEPQECVGSTANLLANPSFEGAYHDFVPNPPIADCPWGVCFSAQMADSWTPYWQSHNDAVDEGWEMLMPEYKPATSDFTDPARVRSGSRAQQLFTFYGTHRAGVMQTVYDVEPGAKYCLSVWGHAWSSYGDKPYTDLSNHGFLNQSIGIDPFGGREFSSGNIVWTSPNTQYDEFGMFKIEVEAKSDTLTVFMNSQPLWAAKHNDVYWDDATLVKSGVMEPPVMTINPTWLAFSAETDSPITSSETVSVTINNNHDSLWWSASVVDSSDFTPILSNLGTKLQIDVDSSGLPAGSHRATIEVLSSDDTIEGGRQYITVQLEVAQSAPVLSVSNNNPGILADDDAPVTEEHQVMVNLTNVEQLPSAAWSATVDAGGDFTPELLTSWGGTGEELRWRWSTVGRPVGTYQASITVRGNDPSFTNSETINLTIVVAEEVFDLFLPIITR